MANIQDAFRYQVSPEQLNELVKAIDTSADGAEPTSPIVHPPAVPWQDATLFAEGAVVVEGGIQYVSLQEHTSDAANDQPAAGVNQADFWTRLTVSLGGLTIVGGASDSEILLPLTSPSLSFKSIVKNMGPGKVTLKTSGGNILRDSDGGDIQIDGYEMAGASTRHFRSAIDLWDVL